MAVINKTALITGATSGIGYELAKLFAKDRYNLVLVARTESRLQEIAQEFSRDYGIEQVTIIPKDLSKDGAAAEVYNETQQKGIRVDILVNDAGVGEWGKFHETDLQKQLELVHLNVIALVSLTHFYLKDMIAAGQGKILQLASAVSYMPSPLMAVYAASKAFVASFSEALINELENTGISLTILAPNATDTDFFRKANAEHTVAAQSEKATAADVALAGYQALLDGSSKEIYGFATKFQVAMAGVLPEQTSASISRKQFEIKEK